MSLVVSGWSLIGSGWVISVEGMSLVLRSCVALVLRGGITIIN